MTVTVLNTVADPVIASGVEQTVPFEFKVFTSAEVEVIVGFGESQVTLNQDFYTVTPNVALDGQIKEGGTVTVAAGAVEPGESIRLRAKPKMTQEQVYSDSGSRLKNLNEGLDRAALKSQRVAEDQERALMFPLGEQARGLPSANGRRETILGFDAAGDPVVMSVVRVLNQIGISFEDDGAWGAQSDPLTYDDGAFV